jgi:cobalt/nickel transport system ATP-binding protein
MEQNARALFELEQVHYLYMNRIPALMDINVVIYPGERIAILGSNGSGKSTLLKMLDGLVSPTSGVMKFAGQQVVEEMFDDQEFNKHFRKTVGFIFQDPDVQLFCPTVRDEILFGPLQLDISRDEAYERLEDLLEMFEIKDLLDRPTYQLSGGEKKRVSLASVLAVNPDVLLLDEPTSGLDPRAQLQLRELLEELSETGKSVITSTHDLEIVKYIADRAIVLDESNRIVGDGPSEQILGDRDLLLRANLIHEHAHRHASTRHSHLHPREGKHEDQREQGLPSLPEGTA